MEQQSSDRRNNRIRPDEILDLGEYERQREEIRPRAVQARSLRRIELGPNATLAFENRETVRYQIQEMLRAERIAKPHDVEHEIETYSDLLPATHELSATLLIEFPEAEERARRLRELVGLENHLRLDIDGSPASAQFDRRQMEEDKISSVQFIRFPITDDQRKAILDGSAIRVVTDHPSYSHSVTLTGEQAAAMAADLCEAEHS